MSKLLTSNHRKTDSSAMHILLVEDNPDDALLIEEILSETESTCCRIQWVDRVSKGKQWAAEHPNQVDLVLLDLFLPDSRGLDTLREFKKYTPAQPIVVLTGLDDQEIGRQAIKEGAQDYICKNDLDLLALENSLRYALERHRLTMELEKKKALLLESVRRFRRIIEKNADGILILDPKGQVLFSNPAAEKMLGNLPGRLRNQKFDWTLAPGKPVELNVIKEEGEPGNLEMRVKPIDWEGETAYLAALRDITERKQLEKSLLIEKEWLGITLRSIGDGVITTDPAGCIRLINQTAEQITGSTLSHLAGQHISEILNLEFQVEPPLTDNTGISYGTSVITVKETEVMLDYSRAPILDKKNHLLGYVYIIRDTTMQKKMIGKMLKIRELESLGIVAGKLAHDYDNVFTVILGNISIAKTQLENHQQTYLMLEKSEKSALQSKELTRQLYSFSHTGGTDQGSTSIDNLLQEVVKSVQASAGPGETPLTCQWKIPPDLWIVEFDKNRMYTALWNIVKNAQEAMPNGGILQITLENVPVSKKMHLPLKSGSYVKISIKDHGQGIEEYLLPRIFDPFFTTKEKSKGMGLPTAFSIIRDHQGTIEAESEINTGTIFTLWLPSTVSPPDKR